jgi:RHS repeat-associated protein
LSAPTRPEAINDTTPPRLRRPRAFGLRFAATAGYDERNRRTQASDPLSNDTTFTYDAAGNLLTVTDPLSHVTEYTYSARNKVLSIEDAEGGVTSFTYDILDRLTSLTDPVNNTTSWTYDALGQVLIEENELGEQRLFAWDDEGNLLGRQDRNARVIELNYDNLDRVTSEVWKTSLFGTTVKTISSTFDAGGRLTQVSDGTSTEAMTYDNANRMTQVVSSMTNRSSVTFANTLDSRGLRTALTTTVATTADFVNNYTRDAAGRLTQVTQAGPTGGNAVSQKRVNLAYDGAGRLDTISRYTDTAGTEAVATSDYAYDIAGRISGLTHATGGTTWADYDFTWDAASRITQIVSPDGTADYTYDDTNQLLTADHSVLADETYSFDLNGNRTMSGYATAGNNRMTSDGTWDYEYDDEGNRTAKEKISTGERVEYAWDHRNRLTGVTYRNGSGTVTNTVALAYDVFDRLATKAVDDNGNGTVDRREGYAHDGVHLALVFDSATATLPSERYLHGDAVDQLFAGEDVTSGADADVMWVMPDHLGTVKDLLRRDNAGTVTNLDHAEYDSFGVRLDTVAVTFRFGYTAREFDGDVGLQWNRARWYDASTGRWVSEDPIGFFGHDTNISRYCNSRSVDTVDPSGHSGRPLTFEELGLLTAIHSMGSPGGSGGSEQIWDALVDVQIFGKPTLGDVIAGRIEPIEYIVANIALSGRATAVTINNHIFMEAGVPPESPVTHSDSFGLLVHETCHVLQAKGVNEFLDATGISDLLGTNDEIEWITVYGVGSVIATSMGYHEYFGNPFEIQAYGISSGWHSWADRQVKAGHDPIHTIGLIYSWGQVALDFFGRLEFRPYVDASIGRQLDEQRKGK